MAYLTAKERIFYNWNPVLLSAKEQDVYKDYSREWGRIWDTIDNNSIAQAIKGRIESHVVGENGLFVAPDAIGEILNISDKQTQELNAYLEQEYKIFAKTIISDDEQSTIGDMQKEYLENVLAYGENFYYIADSVGTAYGFTIGAIGPPRVGSLEGVYKLSNAGSVSLGKGLEQANIRGVHTDSQGREVGYYIATDELYENLYSFIYYPKRIKGREIFHDLYKKRSKAVRGRSCFLSVLGDLKQLDRLCDSVLFASLIDSYIAFFIEKDEYYNDPDDEEGVNASSQDETIKMFEDSLMKLGPASVLELNKGKRIKPFISNRQPQNTIEGIQFAAKRVCAAMNMPFEEVLLVFNKSYTASKAVKNSAGLTYTNYRLFIGNKFCQKVYSRFVDTLKEDIKNKFKIEAKSFRQDLALKNADWLGPRLRSIDEVKDAQAAKLRIDSELSSVPREQKELNVNWSNELRQRAAYLEKKKTLFSPFLEFLAKIKGIFTN